MSDREDFEATYKSVFPGHRLDRGINGDYVNVAADAAWRVYRKAARAQQGEGREPVAWATKQANGRLITASTDRNAELEWAENYVGATVIPLYAHPDTPEGEWVKCSDIEPPHNECVDAWAEISGRHHNGDAERIPDIFYDRETGQWWHWDEGCVERQVVSGMTFTHWMKRPAAPDMGGEK